MNGTELTHFMSCLLFLSINEQTFSENWDFARCDFALCDFPKPMNLEVPQSILSVLSLIMATLCLYHDRKKKLCWLRKKQKEKAKKKKNQREDQMVC